MFLPFWAFLREVLDKKNRVRAMYIIDAQLWIIIHKCPLLCIKYIKRSTMHFGFMGVILLHSGHQHVSGIHEATFRVVRTRTKA
jgi:hypothetical protein